MDGASDSLPRISSTADQGRDGQLDVPSVLVEALFPSKGRLAACSDFDANRQFLVDHEKRVTYDRTMLPLQC